MTMTDTPRQSPERQVGTIVATRVQELYAGATSEHPGFSARARANLAQLRQLDTADPVSDVRAWNLTLSSIPGELQGAADTPNAVERAVHSALVLYAIHAQSAKGPAHKPKKRVGQAVREVAITQKPDDPTDAAIIARFHTCAKASSYNQLVRHLRGLITLLRSSDIALDYGLLAQDLYRAQQPDGMRIVRLRWGRSFHNFSPQQITSAESENANVR
ncbi:MAG: type I-E CRISPR-associated protein Cse2/CasB [Actinobacteria bacterium]|nr:type I-E CRISPR-associated protein Cse2/CasB [Actinomycetota bacterium]